MMMRDIPFDDTRHPGTNQANQGWLVHVLTVSKVVTIALVHRLEEPPADLRQYAHPDILVLEIDDAIRPVGFDVSERVIKRVRIDPPLGALGIAAEIKYRVGLRVAGRVSGQSDSCLPRL